MKGEVIGINNSIASNGGGNEGVGFSIPVNLARWIMNQLISKGRVTRGALGIDLHPEFRAEDAVRLGLDRPRGAWVDLVHHGSPAAAGGLRDGDVILRFQGVEIHDLNHLINTVSMAPIGQTAEVVVWRGRQLLTLRVTVGERDRTIAQLGGTPPASEWGSQAPRGGLLRRPERPATGSTYAMGLELQTLDEAAARRLGLPGTLRGAVVLKVAPDSPLATSVMPLDVIQAVNARPIKTADEAARALNTQAEKGALLVSLDRVVKGRVDSLTVRLP
jgi:serine protease Do